ncbi:hypothetical protein CR194_07420 [Salipaludibacillus keqinensis]|uniref:Uncharacterized protein n=1 Tax=Salipaludibacillus keqinensis TaxID=2045207 RepID=A0A323TE69_9BACI|nr:DUF6143 family protein [Salipaludibacillus keqinensis]PYZ93020.1 hypothetical protein CR194_07420 [Salipaludibacillus keqinensis]
MYRKKRGHKKNRRIEAVNIPIELYQSEKGRYFVGYADELDFGKGKSAWARLYNPPKSKVNLHVNVWTVSDVSESTFRAQFWFNADPPGKPFTSKFVTSANTAIEPIPKPKIKLQFSKNVTGEPTGGIKAFVRRAQPETTLVDVENGKFIFPPGGSFLVFISNPESPNIKTSGRIAFGWWEEPINCSSRK